MISIINLDELEAIIDDAIAYDREVVFLASDDIAENIDYYLYEEHDLEDEELEDDFHYECGENYIISIVPNKVHGTTEIFIENVECTDGRIKDIYSDGIIYDLSTLDKETVVEITFSDRVVFCQFDYDDCDDCEDGIDEIECQLCELLSFMVDKISKLEKRVSKLEQKNL